MIGRCIYLTRSRLLLQECDSWLIWKSEQRRAAGIYHALTITMRRATSRLVMGPNPYRVDECRSRSSSRHSSGSFRRRSVSAGPAHRFWLDRCWAPKTRVLAFQVGHGRTPKDYSYLFEVLLHFRPPS